MSTASTTGFCGPLPEFLNVTISSRSISGEHAYSIEHASKLWPNGSTITYSFLDGTEAQKQTFVGALSEFTAYTNVVFAAVEPNDAKPAALRITFGGDQAWSTIGTDTLRLQGESTMKIRTAETSEQERAIIFHEIGHVLGLDHSATVEFDHKSIMATILYTEPGPNVTLSDSDKAWLSLNYPGKDAELNGKQLTPQYSLEVLNIPEEDASRILSATGLDGLRSSYSQYVLSRNVTNDPESQQGVLDFLKPVVKDLGHLMPLPVVVRKEEEPLATPRSDGAPLVANGFLGDVGGFFKKVGGEVVDKVVKPTVDFVTPAVPYVTPFVPEPYKVLLDPSFHRVVVEVFKN